jgi:predicted RNA-binding protein YlqC (UPF0109 family)
MMFIDVVKTIVEPLVSKPEGLKVTLVEEEDQFGFKKILIDADPVDMGRIVGREGRIINALRIIISAVAAKDQLKVHTEIVDKRDGSEKEGRSDYKSNGYSGGNRNGGGYGDRGGSGDKGGWNKR